MAIVIKSKKVKEDIVDENGIKIGELSFNPNDSTIMKKLGDVLDLLEKKRREFDSLGDMNFEKKEKLETTEDFEKFSEDFKKINTAINIEYDSILFIKNTLVDVFGEEPIELLTEGSLDIELLNPIIDFIIPHIEKARGKKVSKYIVSNSDVME